MTFIQFLLSTMTGTSSCESGKHCPEETERMERFVQASADDRFERFLASRQPFERQTIEDGVRLKHEFVRHVQAILTETDSSRLLASAEWVRRNAREVARQWLIVRRVFQRWIEREDTITRPR